MSFPTLKMTNRELRAAYARHTSAQPAVGGIRKKLKGTAVQRTYGQNLTLGLMREPNS
jgi:hypothetical protein